MIPSDSKFPNSQMPWCMSQEISQRLQPANAQFKAALILATDPEYIFISRYFMANKPPGYNIGKITCVYNSSLHTEFVAHLHTIEENAKKFPPTWHTEALPQERKGIIASWRALTRPFSPLSIQVEEEKKTLSSSKVLPLWYGTSSKKAQSISSSGFTNCEKDGYFGNGMYFTDSAHYASMNNKGFLLLSWVSMREPFPVVSDTIPPRLCADIMALKGKEAYQYYDTHFIPVASCLPASADTIDYFPCTPNQKPDCHQIVVFQKSQALPSFIIELTADLLPSPPICDLEYVELSKDIEGYYCNRLLQAKKAEDVQEQISCLEKLGDLYLEKHNWVQAAKILNGALAILEKQGGNPTHLLTRLEQIPALFLKSRGFTISAAHQKSIVRYRTQLREARSRYSEQFQKGAPIRGIQRYLTAFFIKILNSLILDSQECLGAPPVEWACMGMGSMARDEMCPYSDLEFAFLVAAKTEKSLQYFTTLTQLLELRIINFGETNFPLFGRLFGEKSAQASPTPSGFSMDSGGNSPLGKPGFYELIDTPEELAQFQRVEWMEADIIVTNALSSVCYIAGSETLTNAYHTAKEAQFNKADYSLFFAGPPFREKLAMRLLEGHLQEFKPDLSQEKQETNAFGIKKELYRPFQSLLASLTLFCGLKLQSSFGMVEQLLQNKILSQEGSRSLTQALQQVLALRFEAHTFYQNEEELLLHADKEQPQDPHYLYLEEKRLSVLNEIYRVLIPFHRCGEEFLCTEDPKVFAKALFYDESPSVQGEAFDKNLQYKKAKKARQQAVSLNPNDIVAQVQLGEIELRVAGDRKAISRSLKALALAQDKYGENSLPVVRICNLIGHGYLRMGENVKALEYFQKAQKIQILLLGENNLDVAISYNSSGIVYKNLAEIPKAIECHNRALNILLQMVKNLPDMAVMEQVVATLNYVCSIHRHRGAHAEALELHQKALKIQLQFLEEKNPNVANSYIDIGSDYNSLGKHDKALEFYHKALRIQHEILGKHHLDVARSYGYMSHAYKDLGEYGKALRYSQKTLKLQLRLLDETNPVISTSYNNIATAYMKLGEYGKALECSQKALKIQRQVLVENHPDIATSYNSLGLAYKGLSQYDLSLQSYQNALKIQLQILEGNHLHIVISYNAISIGYLDLKDYENALEYSQKALKIQRQVLVENHPDIATSHEYRGFLYQQLGKNEKSHESYQAALKILLPLYGPANDRVKSISARMNQIPNNGKPTPHAAQIVEDHGCCFYCFVCTSTCLFLPCYWCCCAKNTEESEKLIINQTLK